jgi:hypothetical protein
MTLQLLLEDTWGYGHSTSIIGEEEVLLLGGVLVDE